MGNANSTMNLMGKLGNFASSFICFHFCTS